MNGLQKTNQYKTISDKAWGNKMSRSMSTRYNGVWIKTRGRCTLLWVLYLCISDLNKSVIRSRHGEFVKRVRLSVSGLSCVMLGDLEVKSYESIPAHWLRWHRAAPTLPIGFTIIHHTHTHEQTHTEQLFNT